ncbi:DUF6612 family protein [Ornithinibacillus halotolerans]|uniref:Lipoprotein n=1 Tax=Ornithinibacillus halotolerans TaxID=1274357 RepID=A0A916S4X0_9BACI|nr:DUF6612 family protein [Ornithinibacillus halotolerans]GGA81188.1 hypothetical protein GCM10008025_25680 [Ornithinibacillus halotolerans]
MKKWLISFTLIVLSIGLVACGEKAEDVYNKAIETSNEMRSAEVSTALEQEISMGDFGSIIIESDMEGSIIIDPIAMHQKGTMAMSMGSETPLEMDTEIYFVDEEMYVYESLSGQWIKADSSLIPIDTITANQPDVSEQLKMMEKYINDFDFKEKDDEYIFTLDADGEGFMELTEEMLENYLPEEVTAGLGNINEILEDMEIKKLYIEMIIDSKTYEIKQYNLDMDMTMTVEGETIDIVQHVESEYKSINTIDNIEIPEEILESAVDAGL